MQKQVDLTELASVDIQKVSKEELDACSTCDLHCEVNNGLSEESQAQLAEKTGEEIVDADIAAQLGQ